MTGASLPDADATPATMSPGAELTIAQAGDFRARLLSRLAEGGRLPALDLGGVERLDSAGVQLLLSLRRSLASRGQALHVHAASAPVADVLAFYGLADLLDVPGADAS